MSVDSYMAAVLERPLGKRGVRMVQTWQRSALEPAPAFSRVLVYRDQERHRGLLYVHFEGIDHALVAEFEELAGRLARALKTTARTRILFDADDDDDPEPFAEGLDPWLKPCGPPWGRVSLETGAALTAEEEEEELLAGGADGGWELDEAPAPGDFRHPLDPSLFATQVDGLDAVRFWPMSPPLSSEALDDWALRCAEVLRAAPPTLVEVRLGQLELSRGGDGRLSRLRLNEDRLDEDPAPLFRALRGLVREVVAPHPRCTTITDARDLLDVSVRVEGVPLFQ